MARSGKTPPRQSRLQGFKVKVALHGEEIIGVKLVSDVVLRTGNGVRVVVDGNVPSVRFKPAWVTLLSHEHEVNVWFMPVHILPEACTCADELLKPQRRRCTVALGTEAYVRREKWLSPCVVTDLDEAGV